MSSLKNGASLSVAQSNVNPMVVRKSELSEGITDRHGFFISVEEKAIESEYIRLHPETLSTQKVWNAVVGNWDKIPHAKKKKLCRAGVPQSMRRTVWLLFLSNYSRSRLTTVLYDEIKSRVSSDPELFAVIERDLGRTFPRHKMFSRPDGEGQAKLRGILRAYANFNPVVGYVQGMGFLVATLLVQIEDEERTFWAFVSLMEDPMYSLASLYAPGFPCLYVRFHQLKELMRLKCKKLLRHTIMHNIDPEVYATQWYLTLFSYKMSFDLLSRIWDMFFCEGWKVIHRVAIAILLQHRKSLEKITDEGELLLALSGMSLTKGIDVVIQEALDIKFKTTALKKWEKRYTVIR